jgi:hypothetical protein
MFGCTRLSSIICIENQRIIISKTNPRMLKFVISNGKR